MGPSLIPILQQAGFTIKFLNIRGSYEFYLPDEQGELRSIGTGDQEWLATRSLSQFWDLASAAAKKSGVKMPPYPQSSDTGEKESLMLDKLIRLRAAYLEHDVRSPIPHLVGPPGVGKSLVCQQLADISGVTLHTFNVARISPLELEGVQMPDQVGGESMKLRLLHNPMWTSLREGDIVLLDEFLRGFPEVYNGLLDILTSRQVAGYQLPKVFFIAASNSVATYDEALRDRLLNIPVPDLRSSATAKTTVKNLICQEIGLNPEMANSAEMDELVTKEILPMYELLDTFTGTATKSPALGRAKTVGEGRSVRNLVGQALLREVQSPYLRDLIDYNNKRSIQQNKSQFVLLLSGKKVDPRYRAAAAKLQGNAALTEVQAKNLSLNLQLIEMEEALIPTKEEMEEEELTDDDDIF